MTRAAWLLVLVACHSPSPATPPRGATPLTGAVRRPIATGITHTCVRIASGRVSCWGGNDHGELGVTGGDHRWPVEVTGLPGVEGVAAGAFASCAWTAGGEVWCWGQIPAQNEGDKGEVVLPTKLAGLERVAEVQIDTAMACARRFDGTAACWTPVVRPRHIVEIANVRGEQLEMSDEVACMRAGDEVTCWTPGEHPQVRTRAALRGSLSIAIDHEVVYGLRSDRRLVSERPPAAEGEPEAEAEMPRAPSDARAIVAGTSRVCAIGGTVSCWETEGGTHRFVEVPALAGATELDVGNTHACARTASGMVACWGDAELLGIGRTYEMPPVDVPGLRDVVQVVVRHENTCVRRANGTVACWGRRIGDGVNESDAYVNAPSEIGGIDDAIDISVAWFAGCARLRGGDVACWTTAQPGPAHVEKVPAFTGATRLLLGPSYRCAIVRGQVVCDRGALFTTLPTNVQDVWTGFQRICARHADGHVRCALETSANPIDLGLDVASVGFGLMETCAVSRTGAVACRILPGAPIPVTGLPAPAISMSAAHNDSCALLRDQRVACWSGLQEAASAREAKVMAGISDAVELAGDTFNGCVRHAAGTVSCWGVGAFVGDGIGGVITTPVQLPLQL